MQIIKQSTAYTFRLGPFVDSTDGFTAENALTIAYTDVLLSKAGGALAAKADTTNLTSTGANAHYTCVLNSTDTGTVGALRAYCYVAGALPVWQDFTVMPANVYDSLVGGTDALDVSVIQFAGSAVTQASGRPEVNSTHIDGVAATPLRRAFANMLVVTVASGSTSTVVNTDLTEATSDQYKGRALYYLTGNLTGQIVEITAYNGTTKALTTTATPTGESAANTDLALIV
jgi:hypothetical protein